METVIVVPTYNEAGSIGALVRELRGLGMDAAVLVVDDFSPDGTYRIVEEMAKKDPGVHLLLRKERRGRGWAGIDGFRKALEMGARYVVEMDADGSHAPRFIPLFRERIERADIVIGSRYVAGGKDEARSRLRQLISAFARRYLAVMLGISVADPTSGFRMFKRETLEKIVPRLRAGDPFIVTEVLYYAKKAGARIEEAPIEFLPRFAGSSKLKATTLLKYLFRVWKLKLGS